MKTLFSAISILVTISSIAQTLLKPDRVFDGNEIHENWVVLVEGNTISYVGALASLTKTKNIQEIDLQGATLMP
ncbi:MAG: hypothetical protein WBB27_10890, partial [Maribacter sp.]